MMQRELEKDKERRLLLRQATKKLVEGGAE